jgi:hypothetical protein
MQSGSLVRASRSRGPDFRWSEQNYDGKRVCRKRVIGTVDDYFDCEAARRSVANLIAKVNSANRRAVSTSMTVAHLCSHFEQRELTSTNTWRSYATKSCYAVYSRRWIIPQWGNYELCNVKTIEVESWLRRLQLAKSSCAKIRNLWSPVWSATAVASACEDPVPGLAVSALFLPFRKQVGNVWTEGHGLLRGLSLARTDHSTNNGTRYAHGLEFEINVEPFEAKQLTLPKAS